MGDSMFLMIDNYDSFVYNLVRYFEELDQSIRVVRNDSITLSEIEDMKVEGIIISPGPKDPRNAGVCLDIVEHFKGRIPILGVCLGHQIIGHCFGGEVIRGSEPVHGKLSEVFHNNKGVFKGLRSPLKVTRYHSLVVARESLPSCLEITCETSDGIIMGLRHKEFDVEGVQFHPEAELTDSGHELLNNFIKGCKARI
jgi:para-aminobenzoate synthetase component II